MKRIYEFTSCSVTAGKPFENIPKCPLYIKCDKHLVSKGWQRVLYNSIKTANGDLCNTKYKRQDESEDIINSMEICIEGTDRTCKLTVVVSTYHPDNILGSLDHKCEDGIMRGMDAFFEDQVLKKQVDDE